MGKVSEFFTWRLVRSELRIQSFATPTIICAVFLQFDFSEGQKDDILYCIYYICKVSFHMDSLIICKTIPVTEDFDI